MKSFCVECGKEGRIYRGLCEECLSKRRKFLEIPPFFDLAQCHHCEAYELPGGWRKTALEQALGELISKAAKVPREVLNHHLNLSLAFEDERNLQAHISARIGLEGMAVKEERDVRVRIKKGTCPSCSRQKGQYYEAIVQVRAEDRPVREEELMVIRRHIDERVRDTRGLFVTREERVHGGLDVYLSSNEAARSIVQALRASLGGRVSASPKLHTRRQGRDVYRVTYLLRLPASAVGDVVEIDGRPYLILSPREPTSVLDLRRGERRTIKNRELRKARRIEARVVHGIVVSEAGGEVQVMDPERYEVHRVSKPAGLELEGEIVTLILTDEGAFIAPPREGKSGLKSRGA